MTSGTTNSGIPITTVVEAAVDIAEHRAERVFVVGGMVRDLVMERPLGDFDLDLVVEGDGISFARDLGEHLVCSVREHQPFLTAKLLASGGTLSKQQGALLTEVDVASARRETYERPGALPTVSAASIDEDLWRRDFSANAIAIPLKRYHALVVGATSIGGILKDLTDPCGGRTDIQSATLRSLHPRSFIDDPTRLFRAVRYLSRLSFHFDMTTLAGFVEAVKGGALTTLSPRRVWNEVLVALDEATPSEVIQEFAQRGLFGQLPVVSAADPLWLLEALERLEAIRAHIGSEMFQQAGRVLLVANMLRDGREDVVRAVHESNKVIQRAGAVLLAVKSPEALRMIPDVAAAYCVHGGDELRRLLEACLREVRK